MKANKALGPNSIPTKILKVSQQVIASFSTGVFPDLLKIPNIIPVFKKGNSQGYSNCHPISLISNLSKLIKKLAYKRPYKFLEKHSLLFEKQCFWFYLKSNGFCTKMSSNHVLIDKTDKIQEPCDKGSFAGCVFVAFDTVNYNILLHKLNHYGVRRTESNWFKSYIGTRQQHTTVNSFSSKMLIMDTEFHKALS